MRTTNPSVQSFEPLSLLVHGHFQDWIFIATLCTLAREYDIAAWLTPKHIRFDPAYDVSETEKKAIK